MDGRTHLWRRHFSAPGCFSVDGCTDRSRGVGRSAAFAAAWKCPSGCDFTRRMMAPLVQIENLEKRFGEVRALNQVSFEVESGEWIAIMGPSGSGKTSLI